MKTLNELRESKPYDILFSERRKINGRATPLTEQETKAYNAGFKKGNDALWFESRRAAIELIKDVRSVVALYSEPNSGPNGLFCNTPDGKLFAEMLELGIILFTDDDIIIQDQLLIVFFNLTEEDLK